MAQLISLKPIQAHELQLRFKPSDISTPKAVRLQTREANQQIVILEQRPHSEAVKIAAQDEYNWEASCITPHSKSKFFLARDLNGSLLGYSRANVCLQTGMLDFSRVEKRHPNAPSALTGLGWALRAYVLKCHQKLWENKSPEEEISYNTYADILHHFRHQTFEGKKSPVRPVILDYITLLDGIRRDEAAFILSLFHFTDVPILEDPLAVGAKIL